MTLSPNGTAQSVPAPPVSQQDPEVSLPKDLLSGFSLTPQVGAVPPGAHSPFAPTAP